MFWVMRCAVEQTKSQRLRNTRLATIDLELGAGVTQVKIHRALGKAEDEASFPTGFAFGYSLEALHFSPGEPWLGHQSRSPHAVGIIA